MEIWNTNEKLKRLKVKKERKFSLYKKMIQKLGGASGGNTKVDSNPDLKKKC